MSHGPEPTGSDPLITGPSADLRTTPAGAASHAGDSLGLLLELARDLDTTLDLDEVLRIVAERLKPHVGYDALGILLLDPLGTELRYRFGLGLAPEVIEHWRFGMGQGIVGTVAQTGHPILVADVQDDPRYINAWGETRSELAIPLVAKNSTIGVLDAQSRRPGFFSEEHLHVLTLVAGRVANAIENARLYENLRDQARSLSLLNEVGRELTSILDLEPLLDRVAELVKRIVDFHVFSVLLWDEGTRRLEHTFALRFDERFRLKGGIPLGTGICGTAAALRHPVRVPNVHLDPRYVGCGHGLEIRSELVVPLVFKDRLIGVVDLESVAYSAFTEQHEETLATLASYIAIAIENARLYERVRGDEARLAEDLATAREIQQRLLPDRAPAFPGLEIAFAYAPARQLGGDIYDFLPYREGRLAIMVGDVAGKATAAALQGSLAIGILRGHVVEHPCEPAEMLAHLNEHVVQPRLENRFVAMAFSVYDPSSRTLTVANAGFTRPHLVRDGRVEELPVQGIPLGLMAESRYEQLSLRLEAGDLVIFCSDGLLEASNARDEAFGLHRLVGLARDLASAPAQQVADGLLHAADRHAERPNEPEDDRTVVVLKALP